MQYWSEDIHDRFADNIPFKTRDKVVNNGTLFQRQLESWDYLFAWVGTTWHCDERTLNSSLAIFSLSRIREWPQRLAIDDLRHEVSKLHDAIQTGRAEQWLPSPSVVWAIFKLGENYTNHTSNGIHRRRRSLLATSIGLLVFVRKYMLNLATEKCEI